MDVILSSFWHSVHLNLRLCSPQSVVPAHLCTSPIPLEPPEEGEETAEGSSVAGSGMRRKKRRRKRVRSDTHPREEGNSSSDEMEKEWERDSDQVGQESPAREQGVSALHTRSVAEPAAASFNGILNELLFVSNKMDETSILHELYTAIEWSSHVLIFSHC